MSENNKHSCSSILFKCIDYRLQNETKRWLAENNLAGDCDVVSVAGASKGLSDDEPAVVKLLLDQVKISHDLHSAKKVILLHHSDCGRYKAAYEFENEEEEKLTQITDMKKSEEIIKKHFPDMEVQKVWAQMLDSEGKSVEFQIIP
ncbi:MAG: carbonic anhydrase [Candidatus Paceibacterota bacterium]